MKTELDCIVPFPIDDITGTPESVTSEILEHFQRTGIRHYMLVCPEKGWRSSGLPPMDFYREKAEYFSKVRDSLLPYGIRCGWWMILTIKSGPTKGASRMIRDDGTETPMASCPLDPFFRKALAERTALFVSIAKPEFVIFEDDYSICAATRFNGCFCKHHLAEFAKREGKDSYTREELLAIFETKTPEARRLKKEWRKLMRDSLVSLGALIREEVDKLNPEVPIGTMQSGNCDLDGDTTEMLARALAGKRHIPFSRLFGTFYGGDSITDIPDQMFHALWSKQRVGKDFICYHESDTYPHTRFYTSAGSMRIIMTSAYSWGFAGSTFQSVQCLDDAFEDTSYGDMYREERARFNAIHDRASVCTVKGVQILNYVSDGTNHDEFKRAVSFFGIPYTTLESSVVFLSGGDTFELEDDQVMKLLSKGLFLDGEAAKSLCDRGFGKYLGVKMGDDPVQGLDCFDLAGREIIRDGIVPESKGRTMYLAGGYSPYGNGKSFTLIPDDPACEVLTTMHTYFKDLHSAGMTRFENSLGGRIAILGQGVAHNRCSSLFNYRRQKLFQDLVLWCGKDDTLFVKDAPRVFPIMNEADDPAEAKFTGMLTLSNLNGDPLDAVTLHLPAKWKACTKWLRLDSAGNWIDQPFSRTEDSVRLPVPLICTRPEVFLVC